MQHRSFYSSMIATFGVVTFLLGGCAKDITQHTPAPEAVSLPPSDTPISPENLPVRPAWSLRLEAHCPENADSQALENCVGAYGFTLMSNGSYVVGPAPQGQKIQGKIAKSELDQISSFLQENPEKDSNKVQTALGKIAQRYYPGPFPNPCINAVHDLKKDYLKVTECESQEDCSWLDASFLPVKVDEQLVADDCSYIEPLLVANAFSAVSRQLPLLLKRELARKVCGENVLKPSCDSPTTLQIQSSRLTAQPVCIQKHCRIPTFFSR